MQLYSKGIFFLKKFEHYSQVPEAKCKQTASQMTLTKQEAQLPQIYRMVPFPFSNDLEQSLSQIA